MRRIKRLLALSAGLVAALVAVVALILWGSLPDHDGTVRLDGLEAPVEVVRDAFGVPYIEAASERDGYFALGFVHAQDRLWQMELRRRIGAGRLAELVGEAALPTDRFIRLLRLHDLAAASHRALAPEARALVDAYTAGVNAFLESQTRVLPPEFWALWHRPEPWTAADGLVWVKIMALDLAGNWRRELLRARLARDLPEDVYRQLFREAWPAEAATIHALRTIDLEGLAAVAGPPPPASHGSNAWALAGTRTASGAPLLANDPHLGHSLPGVWYLAGLKAPGLEVVGATLPGLPIFVMGRTDRIAWGLTNTGSDVQDLVVERLAGAATVTPTGTAPLDVVTTTIRSRFGEAERFASRWSVNGPLVSDLVGSAAHLAGDGHALALRWTALEPADVTVEAGFAVPRARDWQGFVAALEPFTNPQQNALYADADGTIGLMVPGAVPVRAAGDGTLPQPGWEARSAWTGRVPYAELPRWRDPPDGLLANANNPVVDGDYPHLLSRRWEEPYRFARIKAALDAENGHDTASFRALQTDVRSGVADQLTDLFLEAAPLGPDAAAWARRLAAWDRRAVASSREATVFAAWYDAVAEHLYADELGELFGAYGRDRPWFIAEALTRRRTWCDDVATEAPESCASILAAALDDALARLEGALGPESDAWNWGRQHPAVFEHALWARLGPLHRFGRVRLPAPGDDTTVAAASYAARATPPLFASEHGVSYRQIVDLGAPGASRFVTTTGQVGHPMSRHRADLGRLWAEGRDVPMARPGVATSRLRLLPR